MDEKQWIASDDPAAMLRALQEGAGETSNRPRNGPSARKLRLFAVACCRAVWPLLTDERSRNAVEVAERFADVEATAGELNVAWNISRMVVHENQHRQPVAGWSLMHAAWATTRTPMPALVRDVMIDTRHVVLPATQAALLRDLCNPFRPVTLPWEKEGCGVCFGSGNGALISSEGHGAKGKSTFLECKTCKGSGSVKRCPWLTPTVLGLAKTIYAERAFDRLPVLGDALEEAGAPDGELLRHLHGWEVCPQCLGSLHYLHPIASQRLQQCTLCWDDSAAGGHGWPIGWRPLRGGHARGCWAVDCLLGLE